MPPFPIFSRGVNKINKCIEAESQLWKKIVEGSSIYKNGSKVQHYSGFHMAGCWSIDGFTKDIPVTCWQIVEVPMSSKLSCYIVYVISAVSEKRFLIVLRCNNSEPVFIWYAMPL
jgi:hypothetical protein